MRRIALINICGEKAGASALGAAEAGAPANATVAEAARFVLDDFKDAYAAYERMSSGADSAPSFEFVDSILCFEEQLVETQAQPSEPCHNVLLLVFDSADKAAEYLTKVPANIEIYGIQFDQDVLPSNAARGLETLCKQRNLKWMGELLVGRELQRVVALKSKPRLGWRRRKVAEATDRLIACVRAGITVEQGAEMFGATKKQTAFAKRNLIVIQ